MIYRHILIVSIFFINYSTSFVEKRIVGGQAVSSSLPFLVSLEYEKVHTCAGVLVSPQMIITAAHCFTASTFNESIWTAAFNRFNLEISLEDDGAFRVPIEYIYNHPSFNPDTLENDISIFYLPSPITDPAIMPAILDLSGSHSSPETNVNVVGWGSVFDAETEALKLSNTLDEAQMVLMDISDCVNYYSKLNDSSQYPVTSDMQCMSTNNGTISGTCNGDSGGPVFTFDYIVVGIVSWGLINSCGLNGDPSVNTPISMMSDWIQYMASQLNQEINL